MIDYDMAVLVVDDVAVIRKIVKHALQEIGFKHIKVAADGKEALSLLRKEEIGLVLCDWNMPSISGLELLKTVRSDSKLKEIPFIMVTGSIHKDNVLEAIKAGVNDYLVKPISSDGVREKIEKVLKDNSE